MQGKWTITRNQKITLIQNKIYKILTFGNKMASTSSYKKPFSNIEWFGLIVH